MSTKWRALRGIKAESGTGAQQNGSADHNNQHKRHNLKNDNNVKKFNDKLQDLRENIKIHSLSLIGWHIKASIGF